MSIDFSLTPELEEIRVRVRTFVDEVVKPGETPGPFRPGDQGRFRLIMIFWTSEVPS